MIKYYETKYLVPNKDLTSLKKYLKHNFYKTDDFEKTVISSVYFDTREMDLYNYSLNGDNEKLKVRIRWYENKLNSKKLQFKFKDGLSVDKINLDFSKWKDNNKINLNKFHNQLGLENYFKIIEFTNSNILIPIVKITYERNRYTNKSFRFNLDYNIKSEKFTLPKYKKEYKNSVLEIKSPYINQKNKIFDLYDLEQVSYSKYNIALKEPEYYS